MREFITFTITYLVWAALALALSLITVACIGSASWLAGAYTAPYFGARQANNYADIAGCIAAALCFTGFVMAFLTVRAEAAERQGNTPTRRPAVPKTGGLGQRNSSSAPLPGSTRPDPSKEHNP